MEEGKEHERHSPEVKQKINEKTQIRPGLLMAGSHLPHLALEQ